MVPPPSFGSTEAPVLNGIVKAVFPSGVTAPLGESFGLLTAPGRHRTFGTLATLFGEGANHGADISVGEIYPTSPVRDTVWLIIGELLVESQQFMDLAVECEFGPSTLARLVQLGDQLLLRGQCNIQDALRQIQEGWIRAADPPSQQVLSAPCVLEGLRGELGVTQRIGSTPLFHNLPLLAYGREDAHATRTTQWTHSRNYGKMWPMVGCLYSPRTL